MLTQDAVLLQALLADGVPHALTDVIDELVKDREKATELLDLSGYAERSLSSEIVWSSWYLW